MASLRRASLCLLIATLAASFCDFSSAHATHAEVRGMKEALQAGPFKRLMTRAEKLEFFELVVKTIDGGNSVTIFAPTDDAFRNFRRYGCEKSLPITTILRQHVTISGMFFASNATEMEVGDQLDTLTAVPLAKTSDSPLSFGITSEGGNRTMRSIPVTVPNFFNSTHIVVHGMRRVIKYPCQY